MPSRSPIRTRVPGLFLYLGQNLYSLNRGRVFVIQKIVPQRDVLQQGTIRCGVPSTSALYLQAISQLYPDISSLLPSKCCPGANGMQHFGHALPVEPFLAGSFVRLHSEDEPE